ncbi:MAG: acyl-CoA desaturase [Nannocystaceae bacterium]
MEVRLKIALIRAIRGVVHGLAAVGLCVVPFDGWAALVLAVGYLVGMLGVTVGYHRYFSHLAFKTSRWFQLLLALAAISTLQRGVLWWAAVHRHHHRRSDRDDDLHSPRRGFWHAHVAWLDSPRVHAVDYAVVADFARFPELALLDRVYYLPALAWAIGCAALGGLVSWLDPAGEPRALQFVVYGFLVRTVLVWHATFAINSLAHMFGDRRYATGDDSRNSLLLALITLGEGWHNNHHRCPSAARNGFFAGEIDMSYAVIRALARLGLVWDVRPVPPHVLDEGRRP